MDGTSGSRDERRRALAAFLRSRRERLAPSEVGLPNGFRRRTSGLRLAVYTPVAEGDTERKLAGLVREADGAALPRSTVISGMCQAAREPSPPANGAAERSARQSRKVTTPVSRS